MLRKFAMFTDDDGLPCAIRADSILAVDCVTDENCNEVPGEVTIALHEQDSDGFQVVYQVKGTVAAVVKEIENCLA